MNQQIRLSLALTLLALFVLGCSSSEVSLINEGAIDHRKFTAKIPAVGEEASTEGEFVLLKKYQDAGQARLEIRKNDSISIHLMQGMIEKLPRADDEGREIGEMAIVIKAFEMQEAKDLDFSAQAADSGRLVYYSDDVREGQVLNFSYLPIYGPITYKGNPIVLQIYIVEIKSTDQIRPMLGSLSQAGSTILPPASPTLTLLDTLGTTLLSSKKEDILFRYSMVLHPKGASEALPYPKLEVSNLIFVRQEDRQEPLGWENLSMDPNDGRIYLKKQQGKGPKQLFRDHTYLTMQIQKGFDPTNLDLAQNTYKKLHAHLTPETYRNVSEFERVVKNFMNDQYRLGLFGELRTQLVNLPDIDKKETSRRDRLAYNIITKLSSQIKKGRGNVSERDLDEMQIAYLLDEIKRQMPDRRHRVMVHRGNFRRNEKAIIRALSRSGL